MKKSNKILYVIMAIMIIIIIIGFIICFKNGFNKELLYSNRQEIILSCGSELNTEKVKEISESVLENKQVKVLEVERFGNAVEIVSTEITEEEKENIITKVNEEYDEDISNDNIDIITVPSTRIRDVLKPYIIPGIITFVIILVYFAIMYHKINLSKLLLKSIGIPVIVELTYYAIIAIARLPFGKIVNAIAIGLYVITIGALSVYFQKEKEEMLNTNKKENDK